MAKRMHYKIADNVIALNEDCFLNTMCNFVSRNDAINMLVSSKIHHLNYYLFCGCDVNRALYLAGIDKDELMMWLYCLGIPGAKISYLMESKFAKNESEKAYWRELSELMD